MTPAGSPSPSSSDRLVVVRGGYFASFSSAGGHDAEPTVAGRPVIFPAVELWKMTSSVGPAGLSMGQCHIWGAVDGQCRIWGCCGQPVAGDKVKKGLATPAHAQHIPLRIFFKFFSIDIKIFRTKDILCTRPMCACETRSMQQCCVACECGLGSPIS